MLKMTVSTNVKLKTLGNKIEIALGAVEAVYNEVIGINKKLAKVVADEEVKIKEAQDNILKAKASMEENNRLIEGLEPFTIKEEN